MKKLIKIAATIIAVSLCATPTIISNSGLTNNMSPVNLITASAESDYISADGKWHFTVDKDGNATLTKYSGNAKYVIVPTTIKKGDDKTSYPVKNLNGTFYNNKNVASVSIPRGITEISGQAFSGASNLSFIALPDSLKSIYGEYMFEGASKLSYISLPDNLETIPKKLFSNSSIQEIKLPKKVYWIMDNAFEDCKNLSSVTFPSSLQYIGSYAFAGTNLSSITIPSNIIRIWDHAFYNCTNLTNVTIENGVGDNLGSYTFANTKISNITIPPSIRSLDSYLFQGCNYLTNITMSENTLNNTIRGDFFNTCPNVKKVNGYPIYPVNSNGKPSFSPYFENFIINNLEKCDENHLWFMEEYLNAMVKYVVDTEIVGNETNQEKIRKIHDWVCKNLEYAQKSDGEAEYPYNTHSDFSAFLTKKAICDGYARAMVLLLRQAGFETYYVMNDNGSHAWNIVKLDGKWYHIDACHDDNLHNNSHYLKSEADIVRGGCGTYHKTWNIYVKSDRFGYTCPKSKPAISQTSWK